MTTDQESQRKTCFDKEHQVAEYFSCNSLKIVAMPKLMTWVRQMTTGNEISLPVVNEKTHPAIYSSWFRELNACGELISF